MHTSIFYRPDKSANVLKLIKLVGIGTVFKNISIYIYIFFFFNLYRFNYEFGNIYHLFGFIEQTLRFCSPTAGGSTPPLTGISEYVPHGTVGHGDPV